MPGGPLEAARRSGYEGSLDIGGWPTGLPGAERIDFLPGFSLQEQIAGFFLAGDKKILLIKPEDKEAMSLLGNVYYATGSWDNGAIQECQGR